MVAYHTGAITAEEYQMLTGKYPYNSSGSSGSSGYRGGGGGKGGYGSGAATMEDIARAITYNTADDNGNVVQTNPYYFGEGANALNNGISRTYTGDNGYSITLNGLSNAGSGESYASAVARAQAAQDFYGNRTDI